MNRIPKVFLVVFPLALALACTDEAKAPAEAAIRQGEAAVAAITDEVAQLAPETSKAAKAALAAAKDAAGKGDWKRAQTAGKEIAPIAAQAVQEANAKKEAIAKAAAARAADLTAAWEQADEELPAKIAALKQRIAAVSKAAKLPKGVTKDGVAKARAGVQEIEAELAKAREVAKTDVVAAGATAKSLMTKAGYAATSLGM